MYDRILVHVDHKQAFERYLPFLESVLRRNIAKEVVLTTAVKPTEPTLFGYVLDPADIARSDAYYFAQAEELLRRIVARFAAAGIPIQTEILVGEPTEAFRTYAAQGGFDLVVIAPTGRRYLLTGKPKAFRRALRAVAKPILILQALPSPQTS